MAKKYPTKAPKGKGANLTLEAADKFSFVSPDPDYPIASGVEIDVVVNAPTNADYKTQYCLKVVGIYDPQDNLPPTFYDLGFFNPPSAGPDNNGFTNYTFTVTLLFASSRRLPKGTSAVINFCEATDDGSGNTLWQVRRSLNVTLVFQTILVKA